jgi:hypothetical protein
VYSALSVQRSHLEFCPLTASSQCLRAISPHMSKNSKKIRIQIVNPEAGCGHTSLQHARRYVRRKEAVWTDDGKLRFISAEEIHAAEHEQVKPAPPWMECWRTVNAGVLPWDFKNSNAHL